MAKRSEQPKEHPDWGDESQLEELLQSGYGHTPPSAEYQSRLIRELDEEFTRTYLTNDSHPISSVDHKTQDHAEQDHIAQDESTARPEEETISFAAGKRTRSQRLVSLRLAMSMAAAASLLLAVALWNSQNAYGWASMLRALEQCGWVQAVSESAGLSGWVSSQRGVLAIREDGEFAFHDYREQTSSSYVAEQDLVYQQPLAVERESPKFAEQLMKLLIGEEATSESTQSYAVISESWREVDSESDQSEIELLVTLRGSDARRKTYKLLARLDAETRLPKSLELLTRDRKTKRSLDFAYPSEGPESIFAMGVPQGTLIVNSMSNFRPSQAGEPRDAESSRLIGQQKRDTEERDVARLAARPVPVAESEAVNSNESRTETPQDRKPLGEVAVLQQKELKQSVQQDAIEEEADGPRVVADEVVTLSPQATAGESTDSELADTRVASNPPRPVAELPSIDFSAKPIALAALVGQVNEQLSSHWDQQGIARAQPASDTEFLRRVYLDLTGRIPVPYEVYDFLDADPATRRAKLVDQLLASRDHATHLATVWRKLLLPDGVDVNTYGGTNKFDQWLADRFEKNLPYDQLVSQLLLAEGRVSDSGPILFYAALKLNPEELAAKTARTFLGLRMECAQCHDHPFDESISQEDFWGFAAHFAQISRPMGKIEMTSSVLRVRDNDRGEVMMPDTEDVVPPKFPYQVSFQAGGLEDAQAEAKSRRRRLVEWLTTKQNERFARATVNRVWQHLFGLGLVEPADDMRADNMPTCPEALETLSYDFAANNYDLRRLLRALVLSDAYQLSSRASSDEPSQSLMFARMNIKSFTADQLYDCIQVATEPTSAGGENAANGALVRFGNTARQAFIEQFRAPPGQRTDYHAGIPQALTLMHGQLVHGATDLSTSGLLKGINAPFYSGDDERIETLFLSTLSRFPDEFEMEKMLAHVKAASDEQQRTRAFGDILWALLNSAEFTFIH